jgi:hypothetical protein
MARVYFGLLNLGATARDRQTMDRQTKDRQTNDRNTKDRQTNDRNTKDRQTKDRQGQSIDRQRIDRQRIDRQRIDRDKRRGPVCLPIEVVPKFNFANNLQYHSYNTFSHIHVFLHRHCARSLLSQ